MWIKNGDELINLDAVTKITVNQYKNHYDEDIFELVVSYSNDIVAKYSALDGSGENVSCESIWDFTNLGAAQKMLNAIYEALAEGKTVLNIDEV